MQSTYMYVMALSHYNVYADVWGTYINYPTRWRTLTKITSTGKSKRIPSVQKERMYNLWVTFKLRVYSELQTYTNVLKRVASEALPFLAYMERSHNVHLTNLWITYLYRISSVC